MKEDQPDAPLDSGGMDRRKFLSRAVKIAGGILVLGGGGATYEFLRARNGGDTEGGQERREEDDEARIRRSIISYLTLPGFRNSDMFQQLTQTSADFGYLLSADAPDNDQLLLLAPEGIDPNEINLENITSNVSGVEWAQVARNGYQTFPDFENLGLRGIRPGHGRAFRIRSLDLRVDTMHSVSVERGGVTYDITPEELSAFISNESIYGGRLYFSPWAGAEAVNHGAYVARPDEPSLQRLVDRLVSPNERSVEVRSHALLHFVQDNIIYSTLEMARRVETLKRPNEVLLTGESDCSGKAILLASLLEQAYIDYRIIYLRNHVAVAVEGNYPSANGLQIDIEGQSFTIVEPTMSSAGNYQIGVTREQADSSSNPYSAIRNHSGVALYQDPEREDIYDMWTGEARPFVN